ncbi:MAG TPA: hypothetical protein VN493_23780 [Thermoanaerobaculia bacterium]|nr:hypothetical protein [Thermoanaerobaculia bacterium]
MRNDDELLRRYLLGELSEEDVNRLEARLIQDDELFEEAEALEADLLDDHAQGLLSAPQRARIERHLASSFQTRSQLALARGLGAVARERQPGRTILTGPWGRKDLSRPSVRALAAAAMLAIAIGSTWIATQVIQQPEEQIAGETPAPPIPPSSAPAPTLPAETPEPVLITEETAEQVAEEEPSPAPALPSPVTYAFQLAMTALRGAEDEVAELRIPPGTGRVDLQLPLNSEDEGYPSFQVVLRDAATGEELVRLDDLQPTRTGGSATLVVPVDAKKLRAGRYSVEVYGGDSEPLGFPEFEVPEP